MESALILGIVYLVEEAVIRVSFQLLEMFQIYLLMDEDAEVF